jgi:hypothetical protein
VCSLGTPADTGQRATFSADSLSKATSGMYRRSLITGICARYYVRTITFQPSVSRGGEAGSVPSPQVSEAALAWTDLCRAGTDPSSGRAPNFRGIATRGRATHIAAAAEGRRTRRLEIEKARPWLCKRKREGKLAR